MTSNLEIDPSVARQNASENFVQLQNNLPPAIIERENALPKEIDHVQGSAIKKLRVLYDAMGSISQALSPYVACRSACSACCHYNVSVFPIEVEFIEKWTGHRQLKKKLAESDFHGQPCPFLLDGKCSIYSYRPMACRKHFALTATNYWCAPERCSEETFPIVDFSSVAEAFASVLRKDGRTSPLDIRRWFGSISLVSK